MKRQILTALATIVLLVPIGAGAVSYYEKAGYSGGGVVLRMDVPMGTVLSAGEEVGFTYQTLQDAFVVVFNVDSEGYVHLLHPNRSLFRSVARHTYGLPEAGSRLVVRGETGVEFVFALTIPERSWIDERELEYLMALDAERGAEPYRIEGDPFTAANIIAAELVRGISRRDDIYLDYTYFYVNSRVDHPCYLCGECDDSDIESDCDLYRIVANFDRSQPLTYPLRPGYAMVGESDDDVAYDYDDEGESSGTTERVHVTFYPYETEVYTVSRPYVYRVWDPWYYDPWYWDPWYAGWSYYPHSYYTGWSWGVGYHSGWWGWWGWGGYWSSRWCRPYYPRYSYCYYPHYGDDVYYRTSKFKSRSVGSYKSSTLVSGYKRALGGDALRVKTKSVRTVAKASSARSMRGVKRAGTARGAAYKSSRSGTRVGTRVKGTARDRGATKYRPAGKTRVRSGTTKVRGTRTTPTRTKGKSVKRARGSGTRTEVKGRSTSRPTSRPKATTKKRSGSRPRVKGTRSRPTSRPRATTKRSSAGRRSGTGVKSAPRTRSRGAVKSAPRSRSRSAVKSAPRSRGKTRVSAPRSPSPRPRSGAKVRSSSGRRAPASAKSSGRRASSSKSRGGKRR